MRERIRLVTECAVSLLFKLCSQTRQLNIKVNFSFVLLIALSHYLDWRRVQEKETEVQVKTPWRSVQRTIYLFDPWSNRPSCSGYLSLSPGSSSSLYIRPTTYVMNLSLVMQSANNWRRRTTKGRMCSQEAASSQKRIFREYWMIHEQGQRIRTFRVLASLGWPGNTPAGGTEFWSARTKQQISHPLIGLDAHHS